MNRSFASIFIILLLLNGCRAEEVNPPKKQASVVAQAAPITAEKIGCVACHDGVTLDPNHNLACTACHGGVDQVGQADKAHSGLIARPGHPAHMAAICGTCHQQQVNDASHSLHFTLENKINATREHFGAHNRLSAPSDIPETTTFATPMALADDMLRRRCLRCHVASQGDTYAAVTRGTGCAACHLSFYQGKLQSHAFAVPTDQQCLSCHYGNYVGSDYHGRYEHDFNWEYRTPYTTKNTELRPYGVEFHDLAADIHQQKGLICIDCHRDSRHSSLPAPTCESCHGWKPGQKPPSLRHLQIRDNTLILTSRQSGKEFAIPPMSHPAHQTYRKTVSCQVCHGQWSFNDAPTYLLLSKMTDYEPWERLTVQASSEVERFLDHNLYSEENELPPTMRDGLTGASRPGVWYMGYGQRRWENMIIRKDTDGVVKVFRPILDLHLSLIEADGSVPFDNIVGQGSGLRPYTPHTTGHAGLFYLDRFKHLLHP